MRLIPNSWGACIRESNDCHDPKTGEFCTGSKIESRAVLGDAYPKGQRARTLHRHAVEVDDDGEPTRVLCSKVHVDHLADRFAGDPATAPTCPSCLSRLRSRAKKG